MAPAGGHDSRWGRGLRDATGRAMRTSRSATATSAGSWATTTTARVRPSPARVSATMRVVTGSRWAVGSSSITHGRSETTARASASRARSPAESPAPSSPTGVPSPSGSARTRSASATWESAAHRSSSEASGRPSRRLSATVPSTNPGRCGSQAMSSWDGPATWPVVGSSSPARTARRVDLPQPDGPVSAVTPRDAIVSDRSSSTGTVRPGRRTVRSVTVSGRLAGWSRRPLVAGAPRCSTTEGASAEAGPSSSSLTRSTTATPSAAAWNSAPTRRSGQ